MPDPNDDQRPLVLLVSQSRGGTTGALAEAIGRGVLHPELRGAVELRTVDALTGTADQVLSADAVIIATPTHFGYMSGAVKVFLEEIYHPCLEVTVGLPWALVVKGDTDTAGAVSSVERIVAGLRWRAVVPPLAVTGDVGSDELAAAEELGATVAASLL